ncbi:MAG: hypothetical protein PHW95_02565 [Patescibacteria group bacterium]|nr:hypothetical protein [Patescibacteria group bacterium]
MENFQSLYDPIDKCIEEGVINSKFLEILAKTNPLSTWHNEFLELDKVYKWPSLKQTHYQIDIEVDSPTIILNGEIKDYKNIIYTKKTKVIRKGRGKDSEESLESYLNEKLGTISSFLMLSKKHSDDYIKLGSEKLSQLLSSEGSWEIKDKDISISGNLNIFESDELLDQLTISFLLKSAREGKGRLLQDAAALILIALLYKRLNYQVESIFKDIKNIDCSETLDDAIHFAIKIIKDDETVPERFRFKSGNSSSLRFFLVGTSYSEAGENVFIPKIREYFRDKRLKYDKVSKEDYFSELSTEKDEEEIEFDVKDEKNNLKLNEGLLASIDGVINNLSERDQAIWRMFLDGRTGDEIGERFGLGKARISQILAEIRKKIMD